MSKRVLYISAGLIVGMSALLFVEAALAQNMPQSQLPPPISPWMSMYNQRGRGQTLSNYHEYVRPRQQAIQEFQRQERMIQQQGSRQRALQSEVNQALAEPRKTGSIGGAKSPAYRQYLHYYQGLPTGGAPVFGRQR